MNNNHPLQMDPSNGSLYCNMSYQPNPSMRLSHQGQTRLMPDRQNMIAYDSAEIGSMAYQSQHAYAEDHRPHQHLQQHQHLHQHHQQHHHHQQHQHQHQHQHHQQQGVPVNNQNYAYMQPNQVNDESSLYQMNNTIFEQPQAYSSTMHYVPQIEQQMQSSVQYISLPNRNIPQMYDQQYQQYCVPAIQSTRQMNNSDQLVDYSDQHDVLNTDTNFRLQPIEQSQLAYQQPMDLHPTIKQQQQQQHRQQQLHLQRHPQQETTIDARSQISASLSDVPTSTGISSYCNNDQMVSSNAHAERPISNLMISQSQMIPRSKSDLESSDVRSTFEQFNNTQRLQNQRSFSSTTTYINQPQLQPLQQPQQQRLTSSSQFERRQQVQDFLDMRSSGNVPQDWLDTICRQLIEHMDRFGICVIDNFLGPIKGELILGEVKQLYNSGQYTKGRLVGDKLASRALGPDTGMIRSDRVIWIDGCEDGCEEINNLIQTLCSVITNSSRLSLYSNNELDKIVINKRTKAHVACYPGNGTRYIKHVDNPNGDGRVITSIYYLNKDWNTKLDGGLLRMFPAGINEVANIEPLFDRVLFFWSDRRNPHEVLPAHKDRFAITVWYISEDQTT